MRSTLSYWRLNHPLICFTDAWIVYLHFWQWYNRWTKRDSHRYTSSRGSGWILARWRSCCCWYYDEGCGRFQNVWLQGNWKTCSLIVRESGLLHLTFDCHEQDRELRYLAVLLPDVTNAFFRRHRKTGVVTQVVLPLFVGRPIRAISLRVHLIPMFTFGVLKNLPKLPSKVGVWLLTINYICMPSFLTS